MYANEDEKKQDEQRLFDQLMSGEGEFCLNINWLSDKALASNAPDRFKQMWKVYLSAMNKIGGELFGGDVYWNTDSVMIEPVLHKLLKEGYDQIIQQLIIGAHNLLGQIKTTDYASLQSQLYEISSDYFSITQRYVDGGVLNSENRMVKWDYIDHANRLFGYAYDIVEGEAYSHEQDKKTTSSSDETPEEIYQSLVDDLEKQCRPVRYFFKKIFRSIKELFGR